MDSDQHHQRARWPTTSHGSVDRQRNDRLGRIRRRQLFEHRRAILRGYTNSDTHANTYSYGYSYSYSNRNRDIHADANSYGNGDSYVYSHGYTKPEPYAYALTPPRRLQQRYAYDLSGSRTVHL